MATVQEDSRVSLNSQGCKEWLRFQGMQRGPSVKRMSVAAMVDVSWQIFAISEGRCWWVTDASFRRKQKDFKIHP